MLDIVVSYVGDLPSSASQGVVVVDNDPEYVAACRLIDQAIHDHGAIEVWTRSRNHFSWLRSFIGQAGVHADFVEKTARSILSERWNVVVPDWISDADILDQRLLELTVSTGTRQSFETRLLTHFLGPPFAADTLDSQNIADVVMALVEDSREAAFEKYPVLRECLEKKCSQWKEASEQTWVKRICEALPDASITVWQWLSAWSLLRNYPAKLLERILSLDHVSFVRTIPEEAVNDIALEPNTREEALTQIDLLMHDTSSQVSSSGDFRKVVDWLSGRLPEEFRHVSRLLSSGRFEPTHADIELMEERFRTCPGVSRSQLKSLRHSVRPDYPTLIDASETWDADRWVQWTVNEYTPYRDWQVHNSRFNAELEKTVVRFSDWYVQSYVNIQGDMDLGLTHSLSFLATAESRNGLSIVLIVDCLPLNYSSLMDSALRDVGFRRHGLRYKYAALPTITENNKQALVWGTSDVSQNTYESLLKERSAKDWGGTQTHYVASLKALSDLQLTSDPAIVVVNYVDGDDVMHADVESRNRTYEDELSPLYFHLAETVAQFCERWSGRREDITLHLVTDHGACRVLDEETKTFDSSLVNKLFEDEKHRVAHVTSDQAEKIPENLWNIGYRFEPPFASTDKAYFLPKGHNTVRKSRANQGYMHGGVTPEEVIVPMGVYRMVAVSWKKPAIRFVNIDMVKTGDRARFYIQRVVTVEIEVQNPNSSSLRVISLEVTAPEADIKSLKLPTVSSGSVEILRAELYFQKTALEADSLDIKLAYEIGGEEFGLSTSLPTEFKSAISGGFNIKDL